MGFIEFGDSGGNLTRLQRWSHYLTLILAALAIFYAFNLRDNAIYATTPYVNSRAGITAAYPRNWLIEENGDGFVFRVRDLTRIGYKTTIQISIIPVGPATNERNVLTSLSLDRSNLATYNILSITDFSLPDDSPGAEMRYVFTATESNPFLESLPVVVTGVDILTIRRGQAIVISFLADARTFDRDREYFDRFLRSLEFQ